MTNNNISSQVPKTQHENDENLFVEMSTLFNNVASWKEVVAGLLDLALGKLHADYGWFSLYDEKHDTYNIEHLQGIPRSVIDGISTVCTVGSTRGGTLIYNNLDNYFNEELSGFPSSLICYPFYSDNTFLGSLFLCKKPPYEFSETDKKKLEALCFYCEKLVENAILFKNLRQARDSMDQLIEKIHILEKIKIHLSKFVPNSVLRMIEESPDDPRLVKAEKNVSVLFLDIAGYTTINQKYEPEYVNFLVETYFSSFLDDIYQNHGDINETSGDGLMILFMDDKLRKSATQAASTAVAIQNKIKTIETSFNDKHNIKVSIGIHSGPALVGSVRFCGTSGDRWTYTASGMTTNISSRLASCATPGSIVVSNETASFINDRYNLQKLGRKRLKNVKQPMMLYSVIP